MELSALEINGRFFFLKVSMTNAPLSSHFRMFKMGVGKKRWVWVFFGGGACRMWMKKSEFASEQR